LILLLAIAAAIAVGLVIYVRNQRNGGSGGSGPVSGGPEPTTPGEPPSSNSDSGIQPAMTQDGAATSAAPTEVVQTPGAESELAADSSTSPGQGDPGATPTPPDLSAR
jgi:hypothetical protein